MDEAGEASTSNRQAGGTAPKAAGSHRDSSSAAVFPIDWYRKLLPKEWETAKRIPTESLVFPPGNETPAQPIDFGEEVDPPSSVDRLLHASMARLTAGLSPTALWLAYADWLVHFAASPGKCHQMTEKAVRKAVRFYLYGVQTFSNADCPHCIEPLPQDNRFRSAGWQRMPFNLIYQGFLLHQQWWHSAVTGVGGVSSHHEHVMAFMTRQALDTLSPGNFIATNPELLETTIREGGQNLLRGWMNFWSDWERALGGKPPAGAEFFRPGKEVASSPGHVVYRNKLIEVIQYTPRTPDVFAEPILIVPAWIMKYYILDLSPENSLVRYLVEAGHTVFMISWHNPDVDDRDIGLNDYLRLGVLEALKVIRHVIPERPINAVGYCLGGTLLAIAAAYLSQQQDRVLHSITLLAAQTDFTEAGELSLFIDESQLNYLEDVMWDRGYLDARQMAGAFQLLRSNDLVWSRMLNDYLMGQRRTMSDLMAWNADTTRMPYRMHSEYLRRMFLSNDLFQGRYDVDGRTVALGDIRAPIFVVATERDHVAPWRSVYKINLVSDADVTFLLTSGGHNAGIVSEPGHEGRSFRLARRAPHARYLDPEIWYATAAVHEGSWWPAWLDWLSGESSGRASPPATGAPTAGFPILEPAPGRFVLER